MFDAKVYDYNHLDYYLSDTVLNCVKKYYPEVSDLSLLHKSVPSKNIDELLKLVGKDLGIIIYDDSDKLKRAFFDKFSTWKVETQERNPTGIIEIHPIKISPRMGG